MTVNIKKLDEYGMVPVYATEGSACFDLFASHAAEWEAVEEVSTNGIVQLLAYQAIVLTSIAIEIPEGYRLDIFARSGFAFKHNITLANSVGKIDSDYRGEIKVKLIAYSPLDSLPKIERGIRIAQAEINRVYKTEFKIIENLNVTQRGDGGFGSTGH